MVKRRKTVKRKVKKQRRNPSTGIMEWVWEEIIEDAFDYDDDDTSSSSYNYTNSSSSSSSSSDNSWGSSSSSSSDSSDSYSDD